MMRTLAKAGIGLIGIALAGCAAVSQYQPSQPYNFSPEQRLEIHRSALKEYENAVRTYGEENVIRSLVEAISRDSRILE